MPKTRKDKIIVVKKLKLNPLFIASIIIFSLLAGIIWIFFSSAANLQGDINKNNKVDISDLSLLLSSYGINQAACKTNTSLTCDLSNPLNNKVDIADLSILLSNYGKTGTINERVILGSAVGPKILGTSADDLKYKEVYMANFGSMTPENEMKFDALQPSQGQFNFTTADKMVQLMITNNKSIRGHTLIWSGQNPAWLTSRAWTRDQLLAVMKNHITTVMSHYKGKIAEWDVVNEPLDPDWSGNLAPTIWQKYIGNDYIDKAFEFARAADPDAKLYINEWGTERYPIPKSVGMLNLVKGMLQRGVPIDGVGFQAHVKTTYYPSQSEFDADLKAFTDLGLDVGITELDVTTSETSCGGTACTDAQKATAQANVYKVFAQSCLKNIRCKRLTTWGFTDKLTWLGTSQMPLPFDVNYNPKPAWAELQKSTAQR